MHCRPWRVGRGGSWRLVAVAGGAVLILVITWSSLKSDIEMPRQRCENERSTPLHCVHVNVLIFKFTFLLSEGGFVALSRRGTCSE